MGSSRLVPPQTFDAQTRAAGRRTSSTRKTSATAQVIEAIINLLRSGRFRPGDRLPSEWELVERLGVGRSAVREGLRELAALHVLQARQGRGTFVRSLRPDLLPSVALGTRAHRTLVRELLEIRLMIEPEAAAIAAMRATPQDMRRLSHDVAELRARLDAGYRPPEDLGFHIDIIRATKNAALSRVVGPIVAYYEHDDSVSTERDVREHATVLDAIRARNAEAARACMRAHLIAEITTRGLEFGPAITGE